MADPISPKDFGASFKGFMEHMTRQAPAEEPFFRQRLRAHFRCRMPGAGGVCSSCMAEVSG